MKVLLPISVLIFLFSGCANNTLYTPKTDEKLTVAKAQNLKVGMSSAEVIEIMGSPNILSTNQQGNEVWVYDKISTKSVSQTNGVGTGLLTGLLIQGGSSNNSNVSSQRTLTIIVKYDSSKKVENISYHTSSF